MGFEQVIPNQDISSINTNEVTRVYRGRGQGLIKSNVKYNFGIYADNNGSQVPFIEHYPVLNILGNPFPLFNSLSFPVDLCVKPTSYPPPPYVRFTPKCDNGGFSPEELQMRRKAETLKHQTTMKTKNISKAERFALVARGSNQKRSTYATQTISFTNPNTKNYPRSGDNLVIPLECPRQELTFPSTESDVPGPIVPLTYDTNVPLLRYKRTYTYPTQEQPPGPNSNIA